MPNDQFFKSGVCFSVMLFTSIMLCGQNNCNDFKADLPTLSDCNQPLQSTLIRYNAIANHFGIKDTIICFCTHGKNQYAFRNEVVETMTASKLPDGGEELILETYHAKVKITSQFNSVSNGDTTTTSPVFSFLVIIEFDDIPDEVLHYTDDGFVRYDSTHGRKDGFYEEKYCNGNLRISGQYCLMDSIQRDTMVIFNPETYEEETLITVSYVHSKKTGPWTYYDINGVLEKEETFSPCK